MGLILPKDFLLADDTKKSPYNNLGHIGFKIQDSCNSYNKLFAIRQAKISLIFFKDFLLTDTSMVYHF